MKWFRALCIGLVLIFIGLAYPSSYALNRRMVQILAMVLVSIYAVASTLATQSMTQNRLMTPSILGIDRLYMLLTVISSLMPIHWFMKMALVVGISVAFYYGMLQIFKNKLMLMLLVGMCVATLFASMSSGIMLMLDPNEYSIVQMSLQASFNALRLPKVLSSGLVGLVGFLIYISMHKQHDVMTLGYDAAHNLGIDIQKYQLMTIVSIILMVASISSMVGPISILGLLCVNIVKETSSLKQCFSGSFVALFIILCSHIVFEKVLGLNGSIGYVISILGGLSFIFVFVKEEIHARYQQSF